MRANPLRWGVQNRPTPRAVRVAVWVAILAPGVCLGIAAAAVAEILTVDWPKGGRS
jgi:hypothetical protein